MRIPDWLRASLFTAGFTFIGSFGITLAGWFGDVADWASNGGADTFPDPSVLGTSALAGIAAAGAFVVNAVVRYAQEKLKVGRTPTYISQIGEPPVRKAARRIKVRLRRRGEQLHAEDGA